MEERETASAKLMVARAMVGWYTRRGCLPHLYCSHSHTPAVTLSAPRRRCRLSTLLCPLLRGALYYCASTSLVGTKVKKKNRTALSR